MSASKTSHSESRSGLLRLVIVAGSLATIFAVVWTLRTQSWALAAIYTLLVLTAVVGVLKSWVAKKALETEALPSTDERLASVAYLAAILVQFSLKFYLEFSWLYSIVIALVVLVVVVVADQVYPKVARSTAKVLPRLLFKQLVP